MSTALAALALAALAAAVITGGEADARRKKPKKVRPVKVETAGNNLSFPVIWAEGVQKTLRGTAGAVLLNGPWWYWWGTTGVDPDVTPLSCAPDPDDGLVATAGPPPGPPVAPAAQVYKAFLQQDSLNLWQAETSPPYGSTEVPSQVAVDWVDWGDNLESVPWYLNSQVRTEVVLLEDLGGAGEPAAGMLEYQMRHLSGWGQSEMHGLSTTGGTPATVETVENTQATVYSNCARLTIQKLTKERDDPTLAATWNAETGQWEGDVFAPIYNMAVWEAGDGPGYYSAEINVKGKIIYGMTWNVRRLNNGAGDYRVTFSLDGLHCPQALNTFFVDGETAIVVPSEEEETAVLEAEPGEPGEGGVAFLDFENNLTYIDIRILSARGGGGGGGGQGGSGGPGGRGGGRGGGNH